MTVGSICRAIPTNQFEINLFDGAFTATVMACKLEGEVVDVRRTNKTNLSTSGGHATARAGNGYASASVSPMHVSLSNSTHDDVYLKLPSGQEQAIQLTNWDGIPIRPGHRISVFWLQRLDNPNITTPILAVKNHDLNKVMFASFNVANFKDQYFGVVNFNTKFFDIKTRTIRCKKFFQSLNIAGMVIAIFMFLIAALIGLVSIFLLIGIVLVPLLYLVGLPTIIIAAADVMSGRHGEKMIQSEVYRIQGFIRQFL